MGSENLSSSFPWADSGGGELAGKAVRPDVMSFNEAQTMSQAVGTQEFAFQAEIKQLLHLLAHSLYQSKEIAIRELISNASDALDKQRFQALSTGGGSSDSAPLEIVVEPRPDKGELAIRDNGIGMTHEELVTNLGTIARSGSLEFLKGLAEKKGDLSLIGQFGVGFYASFMLADKVQVRSKSDSDPQGHEWESDGSGTFRVAPIELADRGTEVILHLKPEAKDFTELERIKRVIRTYSGFIPHPIRAGGEVLNDQKPIWVEPKSQLSEAQYTQFYQHLTHQTGATPLWHVHLSVDSPIQFRAIVYCPPLNREKLGFPRGEYGLSLCAKRVLVDRECRDLVPEFLRFLTGIVDSEDLPLNVSRETLQDNSVIRKIRDAIIKSTLDKLENLAGDQPEAYLKFYREFGMHLKEGILSNRDRREKLAPLLRFSSSQSDPAEQLVSLDDYVKRMKPDQTQIYYVAGPDLATISKSPSLEVFRKRELEVLFLPEPIDEFVVMELGSFASKTFKSIDSAEVAIAGTEVAETPETDDSEKSPGFKRVVELFRQALGERVRDVKASKRLIDSPACLVDAEGMFSSRMERLLRLTDQPAPSIPRILELNPRAALVERLCRLTTNAEHDDFIKLCGLQIWSDVLLLEGVVTEPRDVVERSQQLMEEAAGRRSPLVL